MLLFSLIEVHEDLHELAEDFLDAFRGVVDEGLEDVVGDEAHFCIGVVLHDVERGVDFGVQNVVLFAVIGGPAENLNYVSYEDLSRLSHCGIGINGLLVEQGDEEVFVVQKEALDELFERLNGQIPDDFRFARNTLNHDGHRLFDVLRVLMSENDRKIDEDTEETLPNVLSSVLCKFNHVLEDLFNGALRLSGNHFSESLCVSRSSNRYGVWVDQSDLQFVEHIVREGREAESYVFECLGSQCTDVVVHVF